MGRHAVTVRKATHLCALGQQLVDRDLSGISREPEMWRRFERKGRLALAMQLLRGAEEACQNVAISRGALAAVNVTEMGFDN